MTAARIYHVGIVVTDLAAGMAELTDTAGLSWVVCTASLSNTARPTVRGCTTRRS